MKNLAEILLRIYSALYFGIFFLTMPILFNTPVDWSLLHNVIYFTPVTFMIVMSLIRFKRISEIRVLSNITISLTLIPFIICIGNFLINELPELVDFDRYDILALLLGLIGLTALPIALRLERKNKHHEFERTVKTPAE